MFDTKYEELLWYLRGMDKQHQMLVSSLCLLDWNREKGSEMIKRFRRKSEKKKKHSIPAPSWLVGIPIGSVTRYVTQQPGFFHYPSHLSTDSSQVPPATPLRHGPLDYNIQRPVKKVML